MQVPRGALARPCLGIDDTDPAHPKCTITAPAPSTAGAEMQSFVGQQMMGSYVVRNPAGPGYPFTRLGYTYDWAPGAEAPSALWRLGIRGGAGDAGRRDGRGGERRLLRLDPLALAAVGFSDMARRGCRKLLAASEFDAPGRYRLGRGGTRDPPRQKVLSA